MKHQQPVNSCQQTAVSRKPPAIARGTDTHGFRFTVFGLLCFALFLFGALGTKAQTCPDPAPQTSGSHSFRQQGESFDIAISVADCQPLALELRWSNGRNNGSNFHVTFLDSDNQAIYTKEISGFLTGSFQFPFATLEPQPSLGSLSLISVPVKVTIEAVQPFAVPATISYRITRVATHPPAVANREPETVIREAKTVASWKTENMKAELVESTVGNLGKH